jgi:type I restriction enzyme M protein
MPNKVTKDGDITEEKSIKLDTKTIAILDNFKENGMKAINEMVITTYDKTIYTSLADYYEKHFKGFVNDFDFKDDAFILIDNQGNSFTYDNYKESIVVKDKKQKESYLGNGKIVIKSSFKKATKTKEEYILVTAELTKDLQKDNEIIPFHPNEDQNQRTIATFMAKYITKPFEYLDNTVGVEINFNKVFYKPEQLRDVIEIAADLMELENELANLEKDLAI